MFLGARDCAASLVFGQPHRSIRISANERILLSTNLQKESFSESYGWETCISPNNSDASESVCVGIDFPRLQSLTTFRIERPLSSSEGVGRISMSDDDAASTHSSTTKKRNQYNLEFKLEVASQYEPNVHGKGFEALARQYGISKSNVMDWVSKKALMLDALTAKGGHAVRHAFRLDGCGRKSAYAALEDELENWVLMQNAHGTRVKDKDIKEKAMLIFRDMHPDVPADKENAFKASSGWLARFKHRKNLVVRRPSKTGGEGEDEKDGEANPSQRRISPSVMKSGAPATANAASVNDRKNAAAVKRPAPAVQATRTVSGEWMDSVDHRFTELSQQIHRLVDGQNLLLGMLQRLAPSSLPPLTAAVTVADAAAASESVPTTTTTTSTEPFPPAETQRAPEPQDQTSTAEVPPSKRRKIVRKELL